MLPRSSARSHLCGIQVAWAESDDPVAATAAAARGLECGGIAKILVFFSSGYDADVLNAALAAHLPEIPIAGCSSSGGICSAGIVEHGLVLIAFPKEGFRIASVCLRDIATLDVKGAAAAVRALRHRLEPMIDPARGGRFAISLIDALANVEETVVSTVAWALDGIPMVGGSAADNLSFAKTSLLHEGAVVHDAAIIMLIETDFPTELFKTDNFDPTDTKLVVTLSDAETRTVYELNAEPAGLEYARVVQIDPDHLSPMSFAAHPLVVKIGGEYFCRSIRRLNEDGSLSFFCAIDEGVVLTLAEPRDLVEATRRELARVEQTLGCFDLILGFDCVMRRIEAEARQVHREISDLYRRYSVAGFETYGEQYRSMHLNQTFTGIAIGHVRVS